MGTSWPDPNSEIQARDQLEHKSLGSERPPKLERGDNYLLFGALAGIIIGVIAGMNLGNSFLFVPVGFLLGGIIGTGAGHLIRKGLEKLPKGK